MSDLEKLKKTQEEIEKIALEDKKLSILTNSIKYIIDELILQKEEASKVEQQSLEYKIKNLEDIKSSFIEYNDFFKKNNESLQKIITIQQSYNKIDLNYYYGLIGMYNILDEQMLEISENISYLSSFLALNNMGNEVNSIDNILNILGKQENILDKISKLESELKPLEKFVKKMEISIEKISRLSSYLESKLKEIEGNISSMFSSGIDFGFLSFKSNNVSFIHKDNLYLTYLYELFFKKISKNLSSNQILIEDISKISKDEKYQKINDKQIIDIQQKDKFINIIDFLAEIEEINSKSKNKLQKIDNRNSNTIIDPEEKNKDSKEKNQTLSSRKKQLINSINEIYSNPEKIIDIDIDIEKKEVGDSEAIKLKKEIFELLDKIIDFFKENDKPEEIIDNIFEALKNIKDKDIEKIKYDKDTKNDEIKRLIVQLYLVKRKYDDLAKKTKKNKLEHSNLGKKQTYHYEAILGGHGEIEGLKEIYTDEIVAATIGKTADEIRTMIAELLTRGKYEHLLGSFPGINSSLEGNYIILGPWGGGKTALIKELSQDNRIATIEIGRGDISSMYVGQLEKNIKILFEEAYKIHISTGKDVFIFFDEFDNFFSSLGIIGGGGPSIQKELQTMLDGVKSYPGVHIVGLSNVPHKIPIDIYRRMEKTLILEDLTLKEKTQLILSRLGNYNLSDDLLGFFDKLSTINDSLQDIETGFEAHKYIGKILETNNQNTINLQNPSLDTILDLYIEDKDIEVGENLLLLVKRTLLITPKILWQISEKVFLNHINSLEDKEKKSLDKSLSKLKDKTNKKKMKQIFARTSKQISLDDFVLATNQVFSNESIMQEINGNRKFYRIAKQMMSRISSGAFAGFEDEDNEVSGKRQIIFEMKK